MSEKEKDIMEKLSESIPKLSEKNQGYVLGIAEGMVLAKEIREHKEAKKELQEVST